MFWIRKGKGKDRLCCKDKVSVYEPRRRKGKLSEIETAVVVLSRLMFPWFCPESYTGR